MTTLGEQVYVDQVQQRMKGGLDSEMEAIVDMQARTAFRLEALKKLLDRSDMPLDRRQREREKFINELFELYGLES